MNRSETNKTDYLTRPSKSRKFFKKLLRRSALVPFRTYLALYSKYYRCYSFYRNILLILKTSAKRRLGLSTITNISVRIDISEYSPIILRDLLIALNNIGNQILSLEGRSANLSLNIYRDATDIELSDIFTCCRMNSFVGDIHFVQTDRALDESNAIVQGSNELRKTNKLNIAVSSDWMDVQLQGKSYLKSVHGNCLKVPQLSTRVWASNILKTFKPASFIVCLHVPESVRRKDLSELTEWRPFFMQMWENFPWVQFLLLNYSLDWKKEFAIDLPNVTPTKMLGYNLLEEFALVQSADMYLGSFDKYASVIIGSEKPYLLFGLDETERNLLTEFINATSQVLLKRQNQILITAEISPEDLFVYFKAFYMDLSVR
jgi:hypothetical protein